MRFLRFQYFPYMVHVREVKIDKEKQIIYTWSSCSQISSKVNKQKFLIEKLR